MLITRWQATLAPSLKQIHNILRDEGFETYEENLTPQQTIKDHRHPFTEIRIVVSGELLFNITGNQFLLRAGDRVEVPANTRHSYCAQGDSPCVSVCTQKV